LQSAPDSALPDSELDRYASDIAGPPFTFSVQGTHGRRYAQWIFPDPRNHLEFHMLEQLLFDMVCRRFALVREDMEKALLNQVEGNIPELRKVKFDMDSSGLSEEWPQKLGTVDPSP
jgi:hypothetical protein